MLPLEALSPVSQRILYQLTRRLLVPSLPCPTWKVDGALILPTAPVLEAEAGLLSAATYPQATSAPSSNGDLGCFFKPFLSIFPSTDVRVLIFLFASPQRAVVFPDAACETDCYKCSLW